MRLLKIKQFNVLQFKIQVKMDQDLLLRGTSKMKVMKRTMSWTYPVVTYSHWSIGGTHSEKSILKLVSICFSLSITVLVACS